MNDSAMQRGVAIVSIGNLMFRSKVDAMLASLSISSLRITTLDSLPTLLTDQRVAVAIVDLSRDSFDPIDLVRRLRSPELDFRGPILCYGPHVREDLFNAALAAGATQVVPNSVFSARGAKLINQVLVSA